MGLIHLKPYIFICTSSEATSNPYACPEISSSATILNPHDIALIRNIVKKSLQRNQSGLAVRAHQPQIVKVIGP